MNHKQFSFWQKWLTYANAMIVLVGLSVAFAGNSFIWELHNEFTRDVFFDSSTFSPEVLELKNWLFGIIGGTIVGFHVLMIMISENAFRKKEVWAYKALWYGLMSWFVIDSAISIRHGAVHNVVLVNLVALVLIGLPLIMTRGEFRSRERSA